MKKKLGIALLVTALLSMAALAGPTIGFGFGWYPDTLYFAPSVGMQWNNTPVGLETNLHLAVIHLESGTFDDLDYGLGGFWEVFNLTAPFMYGAEGGVVGFLAGVGTPFVLVGTGNDFNIEGGSLGIQGGLYIENDRGSGFKLLGWWDGDTIGVGGTAYFDLFSPPVAVE